MAEVTQFCVGLDNVPGTLAKFCAMLTKASVNIEAVFASEDAECNWVHLIATPDSKAERALNEAGYHFFTEKVLIAKLENRPGELERVAGALASAGVNISYIYGSSGAEGSAFTLVISTDDLDAAGKVLEGADAPKKPKRTRKRAEE